MSANDRKRTLPVTAELRGSKRTCRLLSPTCGDHFYVAGWPPRPMNELYVYVQLYNDTTAHSRSTARAAAAPPSMAPVYPPEPVKAEASQSPEIVVRGAKPSVSGAKP